MNAVTSERSISPEHRRAVGIAGIAGSCLLTLATALVSTVAPAIAFPPIAVSQILIRTTSGGFNSFFIGLLGHWAMRLAVFGTAIGFALAGAVIAFLTLGRSPRAARSPLAWVATLLPVWATPVILYPDVPQFATRAVYAAVTLPLYVLGGVLAHRFYLRLHTEPVEDAAPAATAPVPSTTAYNPSRRIFIVSLGAGGAGVALGLANLGTFLYGRRDPGEEMLDLAGVTEAHIPPLGPDDQIFETIAGLTPEVTSNAKHYVVDEEVLDPVIDPRTWRLQIKGLVDNPIELTYQQLKRLPLVERYHTLECVSNRVGGNLISTAKWTGVPLPIILEQAGVQAGAVEVVFRATSGYSDSLPADHALDPSTLIAIGMNDHVLPRAHGFPARLLSLGTFGFKNPKWLNSIEVVDKPHRGFWERRGWAKSGDVKTMSRIDVPDNRARIATQATIAGIAYAADRGVEKVEVSTDGGRSWNEAQLKRALSPYSWRLWLYRWTPEGDGDANILVRAYDGTGQVQTEERADPFPAGASGYDSITVDL